MPCARGVVPRKVVPGLRHEACLPAPDAGMAHGIASQLVSPNGLARQRLEEETTSRNLVSTRSYVRGSAYRRKLGGIVSNNGSLSPGRAGSWREVGLSLSPGAGRARDGFREGDAKGLA